jgi:hypothetical protein
VRINIVRYNRQRAYIDLYYTPLYNAYVRLLHASEYLTTTPSKPGHSGLLSFRKG